MKITEHNFIRQLNKGNEKALEYVMWNYGGLVKSVVRRYLNHLTQYEEDCINEIFFAVWQNIASYREDKGSFANWIAGIARLKSLDFLRKYERQMKEESLDSQVIAIADNSQEITSWCDDLISQEMEEMLSCLKEKDRELFYRLYVKEQDMDEVSRQMDMTKPVIYNRVSRARNKIRKKYGRYYGKGGLE